MLRVELVFAALMQSVLVGSVWAMAGGGRDGRKRFAKGAGVGLVVFPISIAVGQVMHAQPRRFRSS